MAIGTGIRENPGTGIELRARNRDIFWSGDDPSARLIREYPGILHKNLRMTNVVVYVFERPCCVILLIRSPIDKFLVQLLPLQIRGLQEPILLCRRPRSIRL